MSSPEVTIAIPTYNRANLLARAVGSALSQTHRDIEVVVCDDGSTDGTHALLAGYRDERLRVVAQPENRGMFLNMNTCLSSARGEYFLMLSDDDYLEPDCVESLLAPWKRNGTLSMVCGQWWYHRAEGPELQASSGPDIEDGLSYVLGYWEGKRPTVFHSVMFRTGDIRRVGGIPEGYAQDAMLILRIAFEGRVAHVRKPVTHYCLQPGSHTHQLNLFTLVRDKASILDMCLRLGKENGIASEVLRGMESRVRRKLAEDAAYGIVSAVGRGFHRAETLMEAYRLRKYLGWNLFLGISSLFLAACAPRSVINMLRRIGRRMSHLPYDNASLRLKG